MAEKKRKGHKHTVGLALIGLLVLGLAGFGVDGFGTAMSTIGKVGDREIRVNDYANALQNQVQTLSRQVGRPLTMAEAFAFGIDRQVRQALVEQAAYDHEVDEIGLSVGDARVQQDLLQLGAFRGLDGAFDREAYRAGLRNAGLTETRFETRLREDAARRLYQAAVFGGIEAPPAWIDLILGYLAERRSFTLVTLGPDDLATPLPSPTQEELRAYYQAHPESYTLPEARRITYVSTTPDALLGEIEIDPARVQALYDSRAEQYNLPERRLVERLVFPDEAAAAEAMARIDAGEARFEDIVAERGLELADTDIGDVTRADLGAAAEGVFAAEAPAVVGPLPSSFGPALYRVNGVLAAQIVPLDEVRAELEAEIGQDQARRRIADLGQEVDDMLAGGATLEEVAADTPLELGSIDFHPAVSGGIAAYPAFRAAASSVTEDDFPEVIELSDGGIVALRLDGIREPTLQPFEEVTGQVIFHWSAAETSRRLLEQAGGLVTGLEGGQSPEELGVEGEVVTETTRQNFVAGVGQEVADAVFAMQPGETRAVTTARGGVAVVRLDAVAPPDRDDPDVAALAGQLRDAVAQGTAQDVAGYFGLGLVARAGASFNTAAINAVHAQIGGTATGGGAQHSGGM